MASNHTNLQSTGPDGKQLLVQHTTTDSPILPAANLEHLQRIDPSGELVRWVVVQTEEEAKYRRQENTRVNRYIFTERIAGIALGALVAIVGLGLATYLAISGHDAVAGVIGGATLLGIVSVLVTRRKDAAPESEKSSTSTKKKK